MDKVKCKNCDNIIRRNYCRVKQIAVDRNKSLECDLFAIKVKRPPSEPMYVPSVDKKTRRLIQKLVRMGIVPVAEDGTAEVQVDKRGNLYKKVILEVPKSTATAGILGTVGQDTPSPDIGIVSSPLENATSRFGI